MRRRRQKNNLLPKMLGIAILVNAILLPILAQLGVFKNMGGHHMDQVRLVTLPPEKKPPQPKRTPPKKRVARARPHAASHTASRPATSRPVRPNPNQPKVVASSGGAGSGGPAIDNSGTAAPGQLPTSPPPAAPAPLPPPAQAPAPPPVAVPPPVVPPPPPAPAPPPPHVPVVVAAEPLSQPQPQIPDDLSYDDIHGDFQALFTIKANGDVTVQQVSSTGSPRLDDLALDAARRWTFRPATVDGKPIDSFRRLAIQFYAT